MTREVDRGTGRRVLLRAQVEINAATSLAKEAEIRGVSSTELASDILEIVAKDGLFRAILDT